MSAFQSKYHEIVEDCRDFSVSIYAALAWLDEVAFNDVWDCHAFRFYYCGCTRDSADIGQIMLKKWTENRNFPVDELRYLDMPKMLQYLQEMMQTVVGQDGTYYIFIRP